MAIWKREELPIAALVADMHNPRLRRKAPDRPAALREMMRRYGDSVLVLAADIAEHGMSPAELPIVLREEGSSDVVVLEGNRRLTALALLTDAELGGSYMGADQWQRMADKLRAQPLPETIECVVFSSRSEAAIWIQRRHTREQGGAGVMRWDSIAAAQFEVSCGRKVPELEVLEFVVKHGQLDASVSALIEDEFPLTTLERIVSDRQLRARLGIIVERRIVYTELPGAEVLRIFRHLVQELALGALTVTVLERKTDRLNYFNGLPADVRPRTELAGLPRRRLEDIDMSDPTETASVAPANAAQPGLFNPPQEPATPLRGEGAFDETPNTAPPSGLTAAAPAAGSPAAADTAGGAPVETGEAVATMPSPPEPPSGASEPSPPKRGREPVSPADRRTLIPNTAHALPIPDRERRLYALYKDLKTLPIELTAVAVAFRCIVEWSADAYLDAFPDTLATPRARARMPLGDKLELMLPAILPRINDRAVRQSVDHCLRRSGSRADSVLHMWVHNYKQIPTPSDCRALWDNLEPFLVEVWKAINEKRAGETS